MPIDPLGYKSFWGLAFLDVVWKGARRSTINETEIRKTESDGDTACPLHPKNRLSSGDLINSVAAPIIPTVKNFLPFLSLLVMWAAMAEEKPGIQIHRQNVCPGTAAGLCAANSTRGNFSVLLPAPFTDDTMSAKDTNGSPMAVYGVGGKNNQGITFSIFCTYNPARPATSVVLDGVVNSIASSDTLVSKSAISEGRGYDLQIRKRDSSAYFRMVLDNGALYQLIIEYPESAATLAAKLASDVLSSFKVIGPPLMPEAGRERVSLCKTLTLDHNFRRLLCVLATALERQPQRIPLLGVDLFSSLLCVVSPATLGPCAI